MVAPEFQDGLREKLGRTGGISLLDSLGEVSPPEREHSERVGDMTMYVVAESGAREDRILEAGFAGILHDVGKVDPEVQALISLARDLSPEEKEEVRQRHTALGASMIRGLESIDEDRGLIDVAESVALYHHHKPLDLLVLSVPNIATIRMVNIIDQFDAMQDRKRPYHSAKPMSPEAAIASIEARQRRYNAFDNLAGSTLHKLKIASVD